MKFVCAPDSFKESLDASAVADAMRLGCRDAAPAAGVDACPLADGGEGTLDVLAAALGARIEHAVVAGPLGEPLTARFGIVERTATAIVELAQASGLALVAPSRRDPTRTTTLGTGELVRRAVELGCRRVLCSIGGSATVDGGAGICQALGAELVDADGRTLPVPVTGGDLERVASVRLPRALPEIDVACDVDNPLTGPAGAARVYGPQKGATPEQVERLDRGLRRLADACGGAPDAPGAGAAGGAGFGLAAVLGARLHRGIDLVLDAVGFAERCRGATLVLTGEGRLDGQSLRGKAVLGAARCAAGRGVPTVAIVGELGPGAERCVGDPADGLLRGAVSLAERFGRERALREPAALIRRVTAEIVAAER
jgi:glycerate kinase